ELNNELSDSPITDEDKIHIPVMDEDVSVGKHTVITGEVTARKHSFEEEKQINETLKKEEARIHSDGDSRIVKENADR
ncbi:MAG: YsnF/AvaK domain-containing protein, partial [Bacillota bacterium]|nr:YsnF/AvaK domain-containing protein [Bacillota bacterium]